MSRAETAPGELIDDREVAGTDQDRLGHDQVAAELEALVRGVRTPTNVALYGPWGSGKSGIANLLQERLSRPGQDDANKQKIKFARFDAFKFAEKPLRRNFISAVATEIGGDKAKYKDDLYTGRTETNYKIPPGKAAGLIATFGLILLTVSLFLGGLAALLAVFQDGEWKPDFTRNARAFVVAGFPFAAVLTGLVALAGKQLGVETRTDKADSDEQFETLFNDLVKDSKADRVVVFVDEIDRCEPKEVVATLDAIRTFLGVPGCVFIVATDQQVLEKALSEDVRQATPLDAVNPYYSAGSAYLDKVFQYQVAVPPLLPQSVTGFAASLVGGRPGVWTEIDRENVVSVLIPSHVRSPRRVKHLLNAFVLAFRLAQGRERAGLLNTDVKERAEELARLVCLQVEFPLFARDLVTDPRLPEYVHKIAEYVSTLDEQTDPDLTTVWREFPYVSEAVKALSERYADLTAPVDQVFDTSDDDSSDQAKRVDQVRSAQGQQLLDYLSKTRRTPGPRRDLIHLQSSGTAVGVDGLLAEQIENSAQDGQDQQVLRLVATMPPAERGNVISLLVTQLRQAFGVEERNVAAALLALLQDPDIDLADRSDAVLTALARALARNDDLLEAKTLRGAWRLATAGQREAADDLRRRVLNKELLDSEVDYASLALLDPDNALAVDADRVSALLAEHLLGPSGVSLVESLMTLSGTQTVALLTAGPHVAERLRKILQDKDAVDQADEADAAAEQSAAAPAAAAPIRRATVAAITEDDGDDETLDPRQDPDNAASLAAPALAAIRDWIDRLGLETDVQPLQVLLGVLLDVHHNAAQELVSAGLGLSGTWTDPERTAALLGQVPDRPVQEWEPWLAAIDPAVPDQQSLTIALGHAGAVLWRQSRTNTPGLSAALAGLVRLAEHLTNEQRRDVQQDVLTVLGSAVTDGQTATRRMTVLNRVDPIVDSGLLLPRALTTTEAQALLETLATDWTSNDVDTQQAVANYIRSSLACMTRPKVSDQGLEKDVAAALIAALDQATWIEEPQHLSLRLEARRLDGQAEGEDRIPLADLHEVLDDHPDEQIRLTCVWLDVSDPTVNDLLKVLKRQQALKTWTDARLLNALTAARQHLSSEDQAQLVHDQLVDHQQPQPVVVARAVGLYDVPTANALDVLIERYEACSNNEQRRVVLDLLAPLKVNDNRDRKRVIERIIMAQFDKGVEATTAGLDALQSLGGPVPRDLNKPLRDAVIAVADGRANLESKAVAVLEGLGYPTTTKGWFFRSKKIDKNAEPKHDD